MRFPSVLVSLSLLAGCAAPATPPRSLPVSPDVTTRGETVYFGQTFPLESSASSAPLFVYERRVDVRDAAWVSTHITRDPAGAVALVDSATHDREYQLSDYTLHTDQRGRRGTVHVDADNVTLTFDGAKKVERKTGDVVVGPTLVGYIVRRMEALRAGKTLRVRFAVVDRLETLGFELRAVRSEPGQTRVEMAPASFFVGLLVDPVTFTFEDTDKLVRIEGRVPPKRVDGARLRDLDARVEYSYVAASYR